MKFYIHHEAAPEFTLAVEWAAYDTRTVANIRSDFAAAFSRATGSAVQPEELQLSLADGGEALPLLVCVAQVVSEGGDIFAIRGARVPTPQAVSTAAATSAAGGEAAKKVDGEVLKKLTACLKGAQSVWPQKEYRKARALYREYIDTARSTGLKPGKDLALAMRRLGEIEVQMHQPGPPRCLLMPRRHLFHAGGWQTSMAGVVWGL